MPPGAPASKIYVTNLSNHTQPLIRFEVSDGLTLLEDPCPCGSAHRRIDALVGRSDQVFDYGGGVQVYPIILGLALDEHPGLTEYQVAQTRHGVRVRVVAEPSTGIGVFEQTAKAVLLAAGLPEPEVVIEPVDRIERLPSGKLRQFVTAPVG